LFSYGEHHYDARDSQNNARKSQNNHSYYLHNHSYYLQSNHFIPFQKKNSLPHFNDCRVNLLPNFLNDNSTALGFIEAVEQSVPTGQAGDAPPHFTDCVF